MNNPKTMENLIAFLHGNKGIAEMFIDNVSHYVDDVAQSGGIYEGDVYDIFWDIVCENDKEDDMIYNLVDILKSLNGQHGQRRDSYGLLAELMEEYYYTEYNKEIV